MSSLLSLPCVADKCQLASLALCQCCKKDLCIDHLNIHANQRNEKLLPFADKINVLLERFSKFYDDDQSGLKQLEEWKRQAYKVLDSFCERKRRDFLGEATDKQREQLNEMHNKLKELIRTKGGIQQDFDEFSENMYMIEQHLDKLEQIQLTLPPLTIDDQCILRPEVSPNESLEKHSTVQVENTSIVQVDKIVAKKESSEKSSKKRKKSSRHLDDSPDRSPRRRSRSPRSHSDRSRRRHHRVSDSDTSQSSNDKFNCNDCRGCRFYQDRFGPGFMDAFGPCSCECHKWAYDN
ncbi:unnamed protein product [Adineta ricciae]|uniref:Uncharacterized protein n=1 Tax=Adineta ricciae TaxID=249248 RepID=A0A813VYH8_ADIRI|nr:unnamed protein product [Adineta ricciae]CAF1322486.1 unnamed protein product [Adineta ricciae]